MKIVFYISLFSLIFCGCKKYPEDETFIHLRKAKNRMKEDTSWHITEYKVNDVDSVPYVNSKLQHRLSEYKMNNTGSKFEIDTGGSISFIFGADKGVVKTAFGGVKGSLTYPILFSEFNEWTIRRMDRKCLIIEIIKNSKKYRVKFETV